MFNDQNSKELYERACKRLATGVSTIFRKNVTPVPLYYVRANGPYYYDVDGHERWRVPLGPFTNVYGMGASPIVEDGLVILAELAERLSDLGQWNDETLEETAKAHAQAREIGLGKDRPAAARGTDGLERVAGHIRSDAHSRPQ